MFSVQQLLWTKTVDEFAGGKNPVPPFLNKLIILWCRKSHFKPERVDLGRGRLISEFEASLQVYRVSSRTARATKRNPVSKNQ